MYSRTALVALVAGVAAFAGGFAGARALGGEEDSSSAGSLEVRPETMVPISNLERAPSMKPLRSAAGAPPGPGQSQTAPPEGTP